MRIIQIICLIVSGLVPAFAMQVPTSDRSIPDDNLAYPVLITLGNGATGSGFFVNNGVSVYLVTAKHVLFDKKTNLLLSPVANVLSYSRDPSDSGVNEFAINLLSLQQSSDIKAHPSEDVVVVKLFSIVLAESPVRAKGLAASAGVTNIRSTKTGIVGADLETLKEFKEVLTGNDILLFGYPTSLGLKELPQLDVHRPLLRKGILAGTNPSTRSLILDCPAYFGDSGGPVVEIDHHGLTTKFWIIGVMNDYVPFVDAGRSFGLAMNSGYSIATPMDAVLELLK